jgi:hypothetical protein
MTASELGHGYAPAFDNQPAPAAEAEVFRELRRLREATGYLVQQMGSLEGRLNGVLGPETANKAGTSPQEVTNCVLSNELQAVGRELNSLGERIGDIQRRLCL